MNSSTETKSILHLTLLRNYFDAIANGDKVEEYRIRSIYWVTRLKDRHYDEVHFRNGYRKDSPFMRVEFKGITEKQHSGYGPVFAIQLGKVLEVSNHEGS
jgi:hypothetical protein